MAFPLLLTSNTPFTAAPKKAPEFKLKNLENQDVSLSAYQGKVVYLSFWASYCGPCKRIFDNSRSLREDLMDEGIVILNVSLDKDEQKWRDAVYVHDIPGEHLIADLSGSVQLDYNVRQLPSFFIINKYGEFEYLSGGGIAGAMEDFKRWNSQ